MPAAARTTINPLSYCAETVRKHDPDRFLLTLLAKPAARDDLLALYAFNYEIARTRETVTETRLGLIRLQWWRDALDGIFAGKPPLRHEVVEPLAAVIRKYNLPREDFETLIYAREFDLEDKLPATLSGMVNYADFTSTPLLKLACRIEGREVAENDARAAGIAYALSGLLRAVVTHARQRRCYLPEDLLRAAGTDQYALYEGKEFEKLPPVVKAVIDAAKTDSKLLPARMATMYLRQIERADYNLLSSRLALPPPLMALRLWWAA
ncbi:MAG TPA: phytoene/squalene synthase family protein [Patescibacteria group bacterium]|nr:phytoene/squalene synthase family protein [Patescibacteria group bacterium]